MANDYSVTIIGAGPTGLMLANLLGKAGVRVLVLEANAATVSEPRAVSIDDESLRVVQQIGLIDVVTPEIVSGYGSEYFGPGGRRFLRVKPTEQPYGHPRRNAFRQPVLEGQLRDGLARFPNVEVRFRHKVLSFAQNDGSVRIEWQDGDGNAGSVTSDFLTVRDDMPDDVAHLLTWCLVEKREAIERQYYHLSPERSPLTYPLDPPAMCRTSLPLHPGARRYYEEAGILTGA